MFLCMDERYARTQQHPPAPTQTSNLFLQSSSRREYPLHLNSSKWTTQSTSLTYIPRLQDNVFQNVFSGFLHAVCPKIFMIIFGGEILVRPVTRQRAIFQHKTRWTCTEFEHSARGPMLLTVHCSMHRKLQTLPTIVSSESMAAVCCGGMRAEA